MRRVATGARLPYGADLAVRCGGADGEVNDRAVVGDGFGEHCDPETGAYQDAQSGDVFTFEGQLRYETRVPSTVQDTLSDPRSKNLPVVAGSASLANNSSRSAVMVESVI